MATEALIVVITRTPRKLKIAAIIIAFFASIALVETQVAIAFGASVQPLTSITPSVSIVETNSIGLFIISPIKSKRPTKDSFYLHISSPKN